MGSTISTGKKQRGERIKAVPSFREAIASFNSFASSTVLVAIGKEQLMEHAALTDTLAAVDSLIITPIQSALMKTFN